MSSVVCCSVSMCTGYTLPRSVPTYSHAESAGRWHAVMLKGLSLAAQWQRHPRLPLDGRALRQLGHLARQPPRYDRVGADGEQQSLAR